MKLFFRILLVLTISAVSLYAQEYVSPGVSESDVNTIQSQITTIAGATYYIADVVNVDSSLGNRLVADGAITNPHNLLSGCYIFTATEVISDTVFTSHGIVGIFKNGAIVWNSGPVINSSLSINSVISAARDLLDDGIVEIITSWYEGAQGSVERLWIFTWNGSNGSQVNAVNENNKSALISAESQFEFVDVNGDGVYEITGRWYENENDQEMKIIIYSWNGIQFGKWTNVPQSLPSGFYPRNKINALVNTKIINLGNTFSYNYYLQNKISSRQMINEFLLETSPDSITNQKGMESWIFGGLPGKALGWIALPGFDKFLKQGQSDSSFYFETNRMPAIVKCFIRGENGFRVPMIGDSVDYNLDRWYSDVTTNSFIMSTIGPANATVPSVILNSLDTLASYTSQSRSLGWIKDQTTEDKYLGYFSTARTKLIQRDSAGARTVLLQVLRDVDIDSTSSLTSEAYALLRFNTEYLVNKLPQAQSAPFFAAELISSAGIKLTTGSLQYYEGSWKDATNNQDGTFSINSNAKYLSLRMTYEYGTQTKSNVSISNDTIVFQTINTQVQLQNSQGSLIDTGTVQYYSGAWRTFGITSNGIANKELLPNNYSFRMSYAYASKDKQQDVGANPTVVFQTVNAAVQLQNSQGTLIDQGTVQYYSGAWRDLGTTTNGVANKELLPNNYSFRMTYAYASKDKQQDVGANPTVIFQTVNTSVQLQNSQGALMDQGTVQYYSGAWRDLGPTTNGVANKELLPNNYSFRMTYAYASKDKQQDVGANPTVVFQTVNTAVQLQNSQGNLIDQGTVQYYSGAWRSFGTTTNGVANKELLPNNYSFRMSYAYASKDKQQDIGANPAVVFQTVNAAVQLQNSQGTLIDTGVVQYYSGAWRSFGTTTNGMANKELLPNTYSFRMSYAYASKDKQQDISSNPTVIFQTVNAQVQLVNSQGNLIDQGTVQYYSGAWRPLGITTNGIAAKELLPNSYSFRMTYEYVSLDKSQDISTNSTINFSTVLCTIRAFNSQSQLLNNAQASYYSGAWRQIGATINGEVTKELLPVNLTFRINYNNKSQDKAQNLSTNNIVEIVIP